MELPVPDQLKVQLGKCKTIRGDDFYKSRVKTPKVRVVLLLLLVMMIILMQTACVFYYDWTDGREGCIQK